MPGYDRAIQVETYPIHTARTEACVEIWAVRNANIHAGLDEVFRTFGHRAVVADAHRPVLAFVNTLYIGKVGIVDELFELREVTSRSPDI